ncbi:unnamed protein product [Ilex paraguariensis]|uniref:Dihydrodipicolinate reductase N-terminal domain-containing protein n=1 Tax=Ilex paraguariensis TaxID=185542 RepID=A0ABC8SLG6_9AQUA
MADNATLNHDSIQTSFLTTIVSFGTGNFHHCLEISDCAKVDPCSMLEVFLVSPYLVNGCTGKMGKAVVEAVVSAGIHIVPVSFGGLKNAGKTVQVGGKDIQMYGPYERERILASILNDYPNLIVVDYTVPAAVNDNVELYCKIGVPFVMGTTGGDRNRLYKTVESSKVYAVISPQMGKQLVAFLATMENMAEQFPGVFSGYTLQVMESHQAGKLDTSGTAKAVISYFQKLGVSFEVDQV